MISQDTSLWRWRWRWSGKSPRRNTAEKASGCLYLLVCVASPQPGNEPTNCYVNLALLISVVLIRLPKKAQTFPVFGSFRPASEVFLVFSAALKVLGLFNHS